MKRGKGQKTALHMIAKVAKGVDRVKKVYNDMIHDRNKEERT